MKIRWIAKTGIKRNSNQGQATGRVSGDGIKVWGSILPLIRKDWGIIEALFNAVPAEILIGGRPREQWFNIPQPLVFFIPIYETMLITIADR
jgi:hypothetical protein